MSNPARNDSRIYPYSKNRGIALLVMLGIILIAFTTVAISRLSLNSGEQKARTKTTQALAQSRDAIMAFALVPAVVNVTNPLGRLPCPDTTGDGVSDFALPVALQVCANRRGLVPFVTLNIPQPLDGAGAPIWYVVSAQYTGILASPYNSSSVPSSSLILSGNPMAFILLAPNKPLGAQVRTSLLPLAGAFAQFLEGDNADGTLNSYTDVRDDNDYDSVADTQNDQALGMPMGAFWTSVDARVLVDVRNSLEAYHTQCNVYPYAANYALTAPAPINNSTVATFEGRLPLTTALPTPWGMPCLSPPPFSLNSAPQAPPTWIATHWGDSLYYAFCPPGPANCLQLVDALGNIEAVPALVMAPGIHLSTQPARVSGIRNGFYELENNMLIPANTYTHIKAADHNPNTFNDLIYVVR